MRNDAVWGADAKMFRPERWLEGSEDMRKKRDLDLDMVFGSGKYLCLGRNVAMMELNKVFVQVRHLAASFR
jgi:cytochrome P450